MGCPRGICPDRFSPSRMSVEVYAELASLAAEEHGLVMDGRYEELAELGARKAPLIALLPEHPPTEALGYLQEALKFQELVTVALMAAKEETARELQQMSSRQTGARGYVSAVHADAPRVSQISRQS